MKCRYIVNEKENKATAGEASICVCVVLNKKKPIIAAAESICRLAS